MDKEKQYLSPKEIMSFMYGSGGLRANDLLNYFLNHQFSYNNKTLFSLYLRLGEVIPSNVD